MVRPIRRIVAGNDDSGKAVVLSDAPSPDVLIDPARPGYASTRLWVTDRTPARVKGIRETLDSPHRLEPPPGGTQCRFIEIPPDRGHAGQTSPAQVKAWFDRIGSPAACVARPGGPHPYLQRTRTTDLSYVLEGEVTLVLEAGEVSLKAGDVAIVSGGAHAWSNRSNAPAIVITSQHSGVDAQAPQPPRATAPAAPVPPEITHRFRRVVTGLDAEGRSCVIADGGTPNVFARSSGSFFYEVWTVDRMPAPLLGNVDNGCAGRTVMHSPPAAGANWRISYGPANASAKSVDKDPHAKAMDIGGGTERRPNDTSGMHRTPSVDYAICLQGDRTLVLEDSSVALNKGDVVIQLGNWHTWAPASRTDSMMSYVMIGGEFG